MNNFEFKKLKPFKWFVLQNFPFIDEDFDAITNYQLFCKLGEEINKIINSQNELGLQVQDLTDAFNSLQNYVNNYFENLDVQEEINNKLDAMVEDGTIESILLNALNIELCFDTVNDMKESTIINKGSYIKTLGFYELDDGGSATYKVTDDEELIPNESNIIELENNLKAVLINNKIINVKQYGAKGNGSDDDTTFLTNAFNNQNIKIYFPSGNYKISSGLTLQNNVEIVGDGASSKITYAGDTEEYMLIVPINSKYCKISDIYLDGNYTADGILDGFNRTSYDSTRLTIENVKVIGCIIGITLNATGSVLNNCYIYGEYVGNNEIVGRCEIGLNILLTDNFISNCRVQCFNEYGIYCSQSSNKFVNTKCAVNTIGAYFKGQNFECNIECQENIQDNIILDGVQASNFEVMSNGAGCVNRLPNSVIPVVLNNYALIKMIRCRNVNVKGILIARTSFSARWSCEGYALNLNEIVSCKLDFRYYTNYKTIPSPKLTNDEFNGFIFNNININEYDLDSNVTNTETSFDNYSGSVASSIVKDASAKSITATLSRDIENGQGSIFQVKHLEDYSDFYVEFDVNNTFDLLGIIKLTRTDTTTTSNSSSCYITNTVEDNIVHYKLHFTNIYIDYENVSEVDILLSSESLLVSGSVLSFKNVKTYGTIRED